MTLLMIGTQQIPESVCKEIPECTLRRVDTMEDARCLLQEDPHIELLALSDEFGSAPADFPAKAPALLYGSGCSFALAAEALHHGYTDYLRLPASPEEAEASGARLYAQSAIRLESKLWRSHKGLMQEVFWRQLLSTNTNLHEDEIHAEAVACQVDLSGILQPVYLHVRDRHPRWMDPEMPPGEQESLDVRLLQLLQRNFPEFPDVHLTKLERTAFLLILPCHTKEKAAVVPECCKNYIAQCNEAGLDLLMQLGQPADVLHLNQSVGALADSASQQVYINNTLQLYEVPDLRVSNPPQPNVEKILGLMDCGMYTEAMSAARDYFYDPRVMPMVTTRFLENYKFLFLNGLRNLSVVRRQSTDIMHLVPMEIVTAAAESVADFLLLIEVVCRLLQRAKDTATAETPNMAAVVQMHILDNLGSDLSRNALADYYFLSPDYLDRLFKRECGQTVTDYILGQRMDAAKQLLAHSDQTVSDIAMRLGYVSLPHFSTTFKKHTGCTPNRYRQQCRTTGEA